MQFIIRLYMRTKSFSSVLTASSFNVIIFSDMFLTSLRMVCGYFILPEVQGHVYLFVPIFFLRKIVYLINSPRRHQSGVDEGCFCVDFDTFCNANMVWGEVV